MKSINAHFIVLALLISLLSGCGNLVNSYRQNTSNINDLYLDNAFPTANEIVIETEKEIFALDEEMENMVKHILKPEKDHERKARLLLNYIFSSNHIAMSYDSGN